MNNLNQQQCDQFYFVELANALLTAWETHVKLSSPIITESRESGERGSTFCFCFLPLFFSYIPRKRNWTGCVMSLCRKSSIASNFENHLVSQPVLNKLPNRSLNSSACLDDVFWSAQSFTSTEPLTRWHDRTSFFRLRFSGSNQVYQALNCSTSSLFASSSSTSSTFMSDYSSLRSADQLYALRFFFGVDVSLSFSRFGAWLSRRWSCRAT